MLTPILCLALGGLLPGSSSAAPPASLLSHTVAADDFEALSGQYVAAVDAWRTAMKATDDLRERAALRKAHPAKEYWDRFEALRAAGDLRAALWMLENVGDKGVPRSEQGPLKDGLYQALFAAGADAAVVRAAVTRLPRDARDIGLDRAEGFLEGVLAGAAPAEVKGLATLTLGNVLSASDSPEKATRGKQLLEKFSQDFVSVGAQAIDFQASTIDGHDFRLSDYRGKVVLVDFYGFW